MSGTDRSRPAIFFSGCNAVLSAFALGASDDYSLVANLGGASFALFGVVCLLETGNLLLLARTFILGFIGYFPLAVKVLLGPDAHFSQYERSSQGFGVAVTMYVVTSFALFSNEIGLALAKRGAPAPGAQRRSPRQELPRQRQIVRLWVSRWSIAGVAGLALALYAARIFIRGYGESIFVVRYGQQTGTGLPFGSVGVIGAIGIFSIFVAGLKGHLRHWKLLLVLACVVFLVLSQLLMGLRQDAMSVLFGLVILYGLVRGRELRFRFSYIPLLAIGYAFFEVWGVARSALAVGIPLSVIIRSAFSLGTADVVTMGTVSPIATTFSNTVYMVNRGIIDFAWGRSYFEWLLRIPPQALYPDRPRDYALMFQEYGLSAGGGFFELAEVYMNFGVFGALIIPGIISLLLGKAYYYTMRRQTVFSYFVIFSFLSVFLRGTWYQTFAFFRAFQVSMLLYVGFVLVVELLRVARADRMPSTPGIA